MKHNPLSVFSKACLLTTLFGMGVVLGQEKQSKSYNESFDVSPDAVVDIDVSYADISFETWDKNQVSVEAIIELEGASPEEAQRFFDTRPVRILGNSTRVEIRSSSAGPTPPMAPHVPFIMEIPEMPEMAPLFLDLQIPDLPPFPEMPPMPPVPMPEFDYQAYKKEGEKYLKKWKQDFDKNFDKDYRKQMESWSREMAEGAEERREHIEAWKKEQEQMREEQEQMREEHQAHREEIRQMAREQAQEAREQAQETREQAREIERNIIIRRNDSEEGPHIFYRSSNGEENNLKVKKTIKIKMPKSVKLNMNVRHGEVKLAENTKDIQATLSYARLLASTIDGDKTQIKASFSPVNVMYWNLGSLNTDFSEKVSLNQVKNLKLKANSSNVTIEKILQMAQIENNLGQVRINGIADNFKSVDIQLQNGELICASPASAYTFKFEGASSKFTPPASLNLKKSGDHYQTNYTGYHLNGDSSRTLFINSHYSDITLK